MAAVRSRKQCVVPGTRSRERGQIHSVSSRATSTVHQALSSSISSGRGAAAGAEGGSTATTEAHDQAHSRCAWGTPSIPRMLCKARLALIRGSTRAAMGARGWPGTCACRYVATLCELRPHCHGLTALRNSVGERFAGPISAMALNSLNSTMCLFFVHEPQKKFSKGTFAQRRMHGRLPKDVGYVGRSNAPASGPPVTR